MVCIEFGTHPSGLLQVILIGDIVVVLVPHRICARHGPDLVGWAVHRPQSYLISSALAAEKAGHDDEYDEPDGNDCNRDNDGQL